MDDVTPAAEATAAPPAPVPTFKPCRHCQVPVEQPKRRGQVKDFCSDRHRAAFRDAQIQGAMKQAQAAIEETSGELARLSARLDGAMQLLERYQRHGTRPRKHGSEKK
jgi:hypothetical protein